MDHDLVYLTNTDTTVGFLCKSASKLNNIKKRAENTKVLQVVSSLKTLKNKVRIPNNHKNTVRRAKKTTFIYQNKQSYRVVSNDNLHSDFIGQFETIYSTSANKTGEDFELNFATQNADIIIYGEDKFSQSLPSDMFILGKQKLIKKR